LTAALLASCNFTCSEHSIEAPRGWANVLSTARKYDEITGRLGETYEILLNTYKPFACGIVIHPAIDGCIQLRKEYKLKAGEIEAVALRVHPLVLELTGKKTPQTGLEGKFSVYFAAALALTQGAAGEREFSDRLVRDPVIVALRDKVSAAVDPAIGPEQVRITITLKDGRRLEKFVEHVVGSLERPMTNEDLDAKFEGLADGVLPPAQVRRLMDLCWNIETLPAASNMAAAVAS